MLMREVAMKVLIISFVRHAQHFPEKLLLILRIAAKRFKTDEAQMKSPQNDVKHEPYTRIIFARSMISKIFL